MPRMDCLPPSSPRLSTSSTSSSVHWYSEEPVFRWIVSHWPGIACKDDLHRKWSTQSLLCTFKCAGCEMDCWRYIVPEMTTRYMLWSILCHSLYMESRSSSGHRYPISSIPSDIDVEQQEILGKHAIVEYKWQQYAVDDIVIADSRICIDTIIEYYSTIAYEHELICIELCLEFCALCFESLTLFEQSTQYLRLHGHCRRSLGTLSIRSTSRSEYRSLNSIWESMWLSAFEQSNHAHHRAQTEELSMTVWSKEIRMANTSRLREWLRY